MQQWIRRIGSGLILWAIPYGAAVPMLAYAKVSPLGFKAAEVSIAIVVQSLLLVWYFRPISRDFLRESIVLAATWAVLNWLLDLVALLPLTHQSLPQYFREIGIEYLAACAYVVAVGVILDTKFRGSAPPHR